MANFSLSSLLANLSDGTKAMKVQQTGSIVSTDENGDIVDKNVKEYRCLSTDTKPTASSVPLHSTLIEMDTGDIFYSDGTSWQVFA